MNESGLTKQILPQLLWNDDFLDFEISLESSAFSNANPGEILQRVLLSGIIDSPSVSGLISFDKHLQL